MLNHLKNEANVAFTTNGARALETTQSYLVDFFASSGALRNRTDAEVIYLFSKAFAEDKLLAMKALFYTRDIRGTGQGERKTFRTIIRYLAYLHPETLAKNISLIPHFGRYDDLLVLIDTPLESSVMDFIRLQLLEDIDSDNPSLLAKWLPSHNTSSYKTKKLAKKVMNGLGLTPKQYRKTLSMLRKKINIVESKMSAKEWSEIEYDKIPSKAGMIYRNAFYRNDKERYTAFIESLKKGNNSVKINAKTLYPYEIVREYMNSGIVKLGWNNTSIKKLADETLESMWKNLPDYVGDNFDNALAVVDTSGSMYGFPITVALSLGVYLAERNKGAFANHFITFSERPQLQEIVGATLAEKLNNMSTAYWDMDTDLEKVFDLILNTAVKNNVPQNELPSKIFIISDMQVDCLRGNNDELLFKYMKHRFEEKGYSLPEVVFWNVNAHNNFPVKYNEAGVVLVSGCSPSIFENLLSGKNMTPYAMMLDILNSDRYASVVV